MVEARPEEGIDTSTLEIWRTGPISNQELTPGHDRQILALDINQDATRVVTASADHGLRLYDLQSGEQVCELFGKDYGHHDWVSSCAFLADGRILSGGNDSLLCLWERDAAVCTNLTGHNSNISKVQVDSSSGTSNMAISSGYDAQLLLWDLDTHECI